MSPFYYAVNIFNFLFVSLITISFKVFFLHLSCLRSLFVYLHFLIISCLSLVPSLFRFSFYISVLFCCPYFIIFSLSFPNARRSLNFLSSPTFFPSMSLFLPSMFLLCHHCLDFLSKFPFHCAVTTFKFFSYFLNHRCFENILPTFIPFVVFVSLYLSIIFCLALVPSLSKFSFYISIVVCCPYFVIFPFTSLMAMAF